MTTPDLQSRLKALSDGTKSIAALNLQLSKLSPSSPSSSSQSLLVSTSTSQDRASLSAEIHQTLKELEEEYELLRQDAEDYTSSSGGSASLLRRRGDAASGTSSSDKENQRLALAAQVDRLGEDLKSSRSHFRQAQLSARRAEQAARRKERELLLSPSGPPIGDDLSSSTPTSRSFPKRQPRTSRATEAETESASADVTSALRRTHALMQAELQRSHFAHETLRNSTASLHALNTSYGTLDTLLQKSRGLVGTLLSSQKSDTWYLETAFWILVYTIAWLAFRRLVYGPALYLLFKPARFVLGLLVGAGQIAVGALVGNSEKGVGNSFSSSSSSSSRPPLKIQPSASNRPPARMAEEQYHRVGRGGSRKREDYEPESNNNKKSNDNMVNKVGKMVEEAREQERGSGGSGSSGEGQEEASEGQSQEQAQDEGTKTRPRRPDEKPNPKKRMMEVPPEEMERRKDEL